MHAYAPCVTTRYMAIIKQLRATADQREVAEREARRAEVDGLQKRLAEAEAKAAAATAAATATATATATPTEATTASATTASPTASATAVEAAAAAAVVKQEQHLEQVAAAAEATPKVQGVAAEQVDVKTEGDEVLVPVAVVVDDAVQAAEVVVTAPGAGEAVVE
jgi:hypothetical protein